MKIISETERLIIREWTKNDAQDLYEYASNPKTIQYLSFPYYESMERAHERIDYLIDIYAQNRICNDYAIQLKNNNKIIGSIGIVNYNEKNEGCVEIGYVLNEQFQGNGYMTEALVAFFKYIKKMGFAKRIITKYDMENEKSGNVMKRAGMTFEGILRKDGVNNIHKRFDVALYSILDEEIV